MNNQGNRESPWPLIGRVLGGYILISVLTALAFSAADGSSDAFLIAFGIMTTPVAWGVNFILLIVAYVKKARPGYKYGFLLTMVAAPLIGFATCSALYHP